MKKLMVLLMTLAISGCYNQNTTILNDDFEAKIKDYIQDNPIEEIQRKVFDKKIPYPSYHVFFNTKNNDTIFVIKLMSHFTPYDLVEGGVTINSEKIYPEIKPTGYFFMNPEQPVIIFDSKGFSKNLINKNNLRTQIPDSLKFEVGKINYHLKSNTEYFKLHKSKIEKLVGMD